MRSSTTVLQVIRFDNRDSGLSTHMTLAPRPDLPAARSGDLSSASYSLSDMAADAVGLLTPSASTKRMSWAVHGGPDCPNDGNRVSGPSPVSHPDHVDHREFVCGEGLARGAPRTFLRAACDHPRSSHHAVRAASHIIGSPGYPSNEDEIAATWGRAFDRAYDPTSLARQAVATIASGDRTEKLRKLQVPTLVVHGLADGCAT